MIEFQLREILKKVSPSVDWSKVTIDADLESAGLDSLDKAGLILEIETALSISIDDSRYAELRSMKDMLTFSEANADLGT